MIDRRQMLQLVSLAALTPRQVLANSTSGFGPLQRDPQAILDLPKGFSYTVIARSGEEMSDGLLVPAMADGMAAFPAKNGMINLVCNHENYPTRPERGPFGQDSSRLAAVPSDRVYDSGEGKFPGLGGTTTIVYDPLRDATQSQFMSLMGTDVNCAGGATPWGTWLSCEEIFIGPSHANIPRERRHGYVFEVPSQSTAPTKPIPLTAMGRFEHEAAAVNPGSGVVYLSEDRHRSLLYRFLPKIPGKLAAGGRLQALAVKNRPQFDTRNWDDPQDMRMGDWLAAEWVDLEDVDSDRNDLRLRGYALGAARFARGEGLCHARGSIFFTCTIGGPDRLGQVFEYRTSPVEGSSEESANPGQLRLLAESRPDSLLHHGDNVIMSPWGDLLVCEDTSGHCQLVGIQSNGRQYPLLANTYTQSELAGICFAPDGKTLFLNIQKRGLTLAVRGPW